MMRKSWYMVAYDVADPKRLNRVRYRLKKEGVTAQKSVFLVLGSEKFINRLLDRLTEIMDPKKDDLRAYPIFHPKQVWTNGPNPLAALPAVHFGEEDRVSVRTKAKPKPRAELKGLLRKIKRYAGG